MMKKKTENKLVRKTSKEKAYESGFNSGVKQAKTRNKIGFAPVKDIMKMIASPSYDKTYSEGFAHGQRHYAYMQRKKMIDAEQKRTHSQQKNRDSNDRDRF